jgi:sialate O-acetylesterase
VNNESALIIATLGENNAGHNRDQYNCTFPKMIEAWRNVWHTRTNATTDPTFPFGFVQVSSM